MEHGKLTKTLDFLRDALDKIQMKEGAQFSFNDIYFFVYEIVRYKESSKLRRLVLDVIGNHLVKRVKPVITSALNHFQMEPFIKAWQDHEKTLECFRKLLYFLEDDILQSLDPQTVQNLGINEFKREVFEPNKGVLHSILLKTIKNERSGQIICAGEFKNVIDIILSMGDYILYEKYFENSFLQETRIYYTIKSQEHLQNGNTISYINQYEKYVHDEKTRVAKYLHKNTEDKILKLLIDIFIKDNLDKLPKLEEDLHLILNVDGCLYDHYLQTLYKWFFSNNCINNFQQIISNIFREKGISIIEGPKYEDQKEIVANLLRLKQRFLDYEKRCFKDAEICSNINSDFIDIFNTSSEMPQYLALHIHNVLRKEKVQERDLEANISTFLELYKILVNKDVFENFYKFNLQKRLLSLNPTSPEIENRVILRLKTECTCSTKIFENIIGDIEISSTHMEMFSDYLNVNIKEPLDFEFSIRILNQGSWRSVDYSPCIFPPSFNSVFNIFKKFYDQQHNGRKLRILSKFGDVQINGNFKSNKKSVKYTFIVSTLQAVLILLFNDHKSLTLSQMHALTDIPITDLKCSLIPIALGKPHHKILNKESDGKNIEEEDVFTINETYTSKLRRIKVPPRQATIEQVDKEAKAVWTRTEAERRVEIDAAIVRIMKTRKTLTHNVLISEVISVLKNRFKPNVMTINSRISHMIEKEYIAKREDGNYVYIP